MRSLSSESLEKWLKTRPVHVRVPPHQTSGRCCSQESSLSPLSGRVSAKTYRDESKQGFGAFDPGVLCLFLLFLN